MVDSLAVRLDAIIPGISQHLEDLPAQDEAKARTVLGLILRWGCDASHVASILSARSAFKSIPGNWVEPRLKELVPEYLDLSDEWHYRRLLELLHEAKLDLIQFYIAQGKAAEDAGIREAAADFGDA